MRSRWQIKKMMFPAKEEYRDAAKGVANGSVVVPARLLVRMVASIIAEKAVLHHVNATLFGNFRSFYAE